MQSIPASPERRVFWQIEQSDAIIFDCGHALLQIIPFHAMGGAPASTRYRAQGRAPRVASRRIARNCDARNPAGDYSKLLGPMSKAFMQSVKIPWVFCSVRSLLRGDNLSRDNRAFKQNI
jgi:hypothetical protein